MLARNPCRYALLRTLGIGALLLLMQSGDKVAAQEASKYYTVQHPDQFKIDWATFYKNGETMTAEVRQELPHYLDLPYGKDVKQRLDLYLPAKKTAHAPVFLFLHGGGFREGDRAQYGFIAKPFAARGVITAVASYRLTVDGFKYPDQPNDAKLALEWLYRNVAHYGGDPQKLYVGGHSAGAIMSADIGVDRSWLEKAGIPKQAFRGIAPVSGTYDLRIRGRAGEQSAYAPTPELLAQASPLTHVRDPVPVAVVAVGGAEDVKIFADTSRALVEKMTAAGARAQYLSLPGEDHKDTVLALGDGQSELFKAVIAMITGAKATSP